MAAPPRRFARSYYGSVRQQRINTAAGGTKVLSVAAAVGGMGAAAWVGGWVGGCAAPARFEDPDPTSRLTALGQAVEAGDRSSIPQIISLLDSDDAAVRLFAILALEEMTGQTLGYDHAAPERERREAADRWQAWYLGQPGGQAAAALGGQSARP